MCDSLSGNELLHLQDLFSALQSANFGQLVGLLGKSKVLEVRTGRARLSAGHVTTHDVVACAEPLQLPSWLLPTHLLREQQLARPPGASPRQRSHFKP